jgi:hypothetical protein
MTSAVAMASKANFNRSENMLRRLGSQGITLNCLKSLLQILFRVAIILAGREPPRKLCKKPRQSLFLVENKKKAYQSDQ